MSSPQSTAIDETRLARLAADLGGDASACRHVADAFAREWEPRLHRIREAARGTRVDQGASALLSIATTGSMLGAHTLAAAAVEARRHLIADELSGDELRRLEQLGAAAVAGLVVALSRIAAAA